MVRSAKTSAIFICGVQLVTFGATGCIVAPSVEATLGVGVLMSTSSRVSPAARHIAEGSFPATVAFSQELSAIAGLPQPAGGAPQSTLDSAARQARMPSAEACCPRFSIVIVSVESYFPERHRGDTVSPPR